MRHTATLRRLFYMRLLTSFIRDKRKPLNQKIYPKKWEISKFSIATDDSVSGQLQKLIAGARKS